jgi:hypothetical protein
MPSQVQQAADQQSAPEQHAPGGTPLRSRSRPAASAPLSAVHRPTTSPGPPAEGRAASSTSANPQRPGVQQARERGTRCSSRHHAPTQGKTPHLCHEGLCCRLLGIVVVHDDAAVLRALVIALPAGRRRHASVSRTGAAAGREGGLTQRAQPPLPDPRHTHRSLVVGSCMTNSASSTSS